MDIAYFCVIWSVFLTVCQGLTENCPSRYTIQTKSSDEITVKVRRIQNQRYCDKLFTDGSGAATTENRIRPTVLVPYLKNGQYFLNITWRTKADYNNYLPRKYVLRFDYSIPERNISYRSECLMLKLQDRATWSDERSLTMFLDCIKVLEDTKDGFFSIQVWQKQPGKCGRPRKTRSFLPCDKLQKSDRHHYTMALDDYKHEICSCHYTDDSLVNIHTETDEKTDYISFLVTLPDLPDFLQYAEVTIKANHEDLYTKLLDSSSIHNNTIVFSTDPLPRKAGTYFLIFHYECVASGNHGNDLGDGCFPTDRHNITLTKVSVQSISEEKSLAVYGAIGSGGVVVVGLVTGVIICLCRKHSQRRGKVPTTNLLEGQNNTNENNHGQYVELQVIPNEDEQTEQTELLQVNSTQDSVIILSHPYDMEPVFTDIRDTLRTKHFKVQNGRDENWRHFATCVPTSAQTGEKQNVIVFVSMGLLELLYSDEDVKSRRLEERQYENVPAVVLGGLKLLDHSVRQNIVLHIVSINSNKGRELTERFVEEHRYLKCFVTLEYYFYNTSLDLADNENELRRLTDNFQRQFSSVTTMC